jgi:hypothetical protein
VRERENRPILRAYIGIAPTSVELTIRDAEELAEADRGPVSIHSAGMVLRRRCCACCAVAR